MTKTTEYGVFLPVGSGGWIPSTNAPVIDGSYLLNREVAKIADDLGFDFTLSQAVWRGYGGATNHFDNNLESLTTAAGLAEATERVKVMGTVNTSLIHPAVAAKVVATVDQISGGRAGLNIVAGGNRASEIQMGLGSELDNTEKYRRAAEWISIVKRLWTEHSVDFEGEYFSLKDCQSGPKPLAGIPPLICAATSDTGMAFVAEHMDGVMFEGTTRDDVVTMGQRARRISAERGAALSSHCIFMIVPGETDAEAERRVELYKQNKDVEALDKMAAEWGIRRRDATSADPHAQDWWNSMALSTGTVAGSPDTIAERLADMIDAAELDSAIFIMPDFIGDLRIIGEEVLPALARLGFPQSGARADTLSVG